MQLSTSNEAQLLPSSFRYFYFSLCAIAIIANFPGRANPDTMGMIWEAKDATRIADWHAPFVTFIHNFLSPLLGAPAGGLVIQTAMLMTWPALVFSRIFASVRTPMIYRSAGLLLWVLTSAMLIALSGQIIKDVLTVAVISLGIFTADITTRAKNVFPFYAALFSILVSVTLIRPTNIVIVAATIFCCLLLRKKLFSAALAAICISAVILATSISFNKFALPAKKSPVVSALLIFDVAGISANIGENLLEPLYTEGQRPTSNAMSCYTPRTPNELIWGKCKDQWQAVVTKQHELMTLWFKSIIRHPLAYALHRTKFTYQLLRRTDNSDRVIVPPPPDFTLATNHPNFISIMSESYREGVQYWNPTISYVPFGHIAYSWLRSWLGYPILWIIIVTAGLAVGRKSGERNARSGENSLRRTDSPLTRKTRTMMTSMMTSVSGAN